MNTGDLIGQLLQSGLARGAGSRRQAAGKSQPGLGDLLGGLLGGGGAGGSGGGLGGLSEMASQYLGQAKQTAARNPKLAAGGLGAVVGSVLGGGKISSGLGGAAIGVIGMIAMNALRSAGQHPGETAAPAAAPAGAVTPAEIPAPAESTQRLLLMAMIAAAKADGHVDEQEMNLIVGKLKENGASGEDRDWVLRELSKPMDIDALVAAVPGLEVAAQVYAASILAITADTPQEVAYLDQFASKLGLQPAVRSYIHQSLGLPLPS
jgi:uncharacterized membrane protein YebE (DUF533 family)